MPLAGRQWKPREVTRLLWEHDWVNADNLMVMTAVVGAESNYYEHAWHWNDPAEHGDGSTDWGMFQENDGNVGGVAPNSDGYPLHGGIKSVTQIRAFRDRVWDPTQAVLIAREQYEARSFSPWAAYNNQSYKKHISKACIAMCNFLAELHGLEPIV